MSDEGTSRRIVTIKIGDTLIECSKDDLIQRSRYFAAMFSGRFREDSQDVVELKVIPEIITPVLKQLLSGNVLEIQNITQPLLLLHAAVIYQFDREIEDCQQMIFKDLFSYLPAAIEVATELDLVQLKKKAILVFLVHFEQLRSSSSFAAIDDVELIYEILNHDNLVAYSEKNVYCAMSFWLSHNASEHNTFQRLIQAIRFAKLDTQDIYEINDELTSRQDFGCQDFLIVMASVASREETFICMNCVDDKTGEPCTCRITGEMKTVVLEVWRKERISPFVPCLVAVERNEKSSLYRYEPHNGRFACLWDCPPHQIAIRKKKSLIGYRLATVGVFIYLFGGEWGLGRGSFNTEVWCFSTLSESWTRAGKSLKHVRFQLMDWSLEGRSGEHREKP